MYGQFKICRKNERYAKSSFPGSIYDTINLPLMNITLMNIIDTEQFTTYISTCTCTDDKKLKFIVGHSKDSKTI